MSKQQRDAIDAALHAGRYMPAGDRSADEAIDEVARFFKRHLPR